MVNWRSSAQLNFFFNLRASMLNQNVCEIGQKNLRQILYTTTNQQTSSKPLTQDISHKVYNLALSQRTKNTHLFYAIKSLFRIHIHGAEEAGKKNLCCVPHGEALFLLSMDW